VDAGATFAVARDGLFGDLAERDRRLAYELAAGVLRLRAELDRLLPLATTDPRLRDILRLGAYQLRRLTRVPAYAAVATSVELAREAGGEGAAGYVNQALRRLAREAGGGKREAGRTHPEWLAERWRRRFGMAQAARLMAWNDTKPPLTLQPARVDGATLRARLEAAGFRVEEAPYGAGVRVIGGGDASRLPLAAQLPGFAEGAFIVQDPAAALICRFVAAPPGALVYDACASPGGKAVGLERLGARVVAGDGRRDRIGRLAETARRAGVAIRVMAADLVTAPLGSARVDGVLIDAPCSATGTMARHPDARWRVSPRGIARVAERQRALLACAAALVKPGGWLVYATCSLEPEENAAQVDAFLGLHPDFRRDPPLPGPVPSALLTSAGDFESLPQRDGIDGAYAARLRRTG